MKPFKIALGIGAIALLVSGAFWVKGKLDYAKDERQITALIGDLHQMGVATTSEGFFHKIPDKNNAWVEIGPILLDKGGKGGSPLFHSDLSMDFVKSCGPADIPLIQQYLANNQSKREAISAALAAKPMIQVPHDYDEGLVMLLPETMQFKVVAREFLLAAYVAGMAENTAEATKNLEIAVRLDNQMRERGEWVPALVGATIHNDIVKTCLRIVEESPNMLEPIKAFVSTKDLFAPFDNRRILESRFLEEMATDRYFDSPALDRREPIFPFSLIIKKPESGSAFDSVKAQHSDYVPQSRNMRHYMRVRLEQWKPFLVELHKSGDKSYIPPFTSYPNDQSALWETTSEFRAIMGSDATNDDRKATYRQFASLTATGKIYEILWQALEVKRKTGKYPAQIDSAVLSGPDFKAVDGLEYSVSPNGIIVKSMGLLDDGNPIRKVSFPLSLAMKPDTLKSIKERVEKYRTGQIGFDGKDLSKFGVPPGPPNYKSSP